jgi:hypothetical protein
MQLTLSGPGAPELRRKALKLIRIAEGERFRD